MKITKKQTFVYLIILLIVYSCKSDKKDILLDMNNIKMPNYEELKSVTKSQDTLKVLIIGNSLASHGIAKEIGWNYKRGMASTSIDKDYVHLLFSKFNNTGKNVILRYANYATLERYPEQINLKHPNIQELYKFNPTYIIYQLGDNTTKTSQDEFEKVSVKLLEGFKNSKIYVVSPYFMTPDNYRAVKKISDDTNSNFVDISYISADKKYKANNYPDSIKKSWKVEGIAAHPSDLGMQEISGFIFKNLNL